MKTHRHTEIITELHEVTVIRLPQDTAAAYCPACLAATEHLSQNQPPADAELLTAGKPTSKAHYGETESGLSPDCSEPRLTKCKSGD